MSEEKKESSIEKLESEVLDFQKQWIEQWQKFLTNDFHHLVEDVTTLIKQNDKQHTELQQGMEIMSKDIRTGRNVAQAQDAGIITLLERIEKKCGNS